MIPSATTGDDAASERACRALAMSSEEFSRGGRQHIAKQSLFDHQRRQRHPQRHAVHRRNRLRLREMTRCRPQHTDPDQRRIAPRIREAPFS